MSLANFLSSLKIIGVSALIVNIGAFLPLVVFSQPRKSEPLGKPVDVRANLRVQNSKGELVNDLRVEEVKVFEDNVEQSVKYFARKDLSLHVVLAVDNSGSMRTHLPIVTAVAKTLAGTLRPDDMITVMRFVSSDKIEVLQEWTSDKAAAIKALDLMYIEGGQSAVLDAVFLAGESLKGQRKSNDTARFAAVVISDFEDVDSYYRTDKVFDLISGTDIQVFPLLLRPNQDFIKKRTSAEELAQRLAVRTGGTAFLFEEKITREIIAAKLTSLVIELRSQYILGYTSTNLERNTRRTLRVEISDSKTGEKRLGQIREGYVLPKD